MARHLKLKVCAEGVETLDQATFLIDHGCHLLQGYYYGRPEPICENDEEDGLIPALESQHSM